MLSNLLKNVLKNAISLYFDKIKIKCNADQPYLVFSELKPEMYLYFFLPNKALINAHSPLEMFH